MKRDQTWGGTNPRLRPGLWYPRFLLPRVIPERPGYVGTTKVDDEIGRVDKIEAAKAIGSPGGFRFDPPAFRFFEPQVLGHVRSFICGSGDCIVG